MSSSLSVPPPADEPDDGYNPTWDPETYPDTISGQVESRTTLKFRQPRGERDTFEKLVIGTPDGEFVDVLCGRANLARLVIKNDPRPGDSVSITAFGPNEKGAHRYGMNVDKSARFVAGDVEPTQTAEASRAVNEPLPFGDEEAS